MQKMIKGQQHTTKMEIMITTITQPARPLASTLVQAWEGHDWLDGKRDEEVAAVLAQDG